MAAKYLFQYYNGATWTALSGVTYDHTLEELNGTEEFIFNLPNTSANRAIIANNVLLNASYNGSVIFYGLLTGADYTAANLQCKVYNPVFVALKQATGVLNQSYISTAANSIFADILALTAAQVSPYIPAITAGVCPTTAVSIKFTNANPFDAVVSLTKDLGLYYWGDGNALTINIGTRDNTVQTPTIYEQGTKRGVDRSKQIGQVVIKGTDINGVQIQGSAGTTGAIKYFTDSKAADVATLNTLAAYKLTLLNNPSTGNPVVVLTDQAYTYKPGQYVSISRADLALSGSFIIQRITKRDVLTTIDVDVPVNQDDVYLTETDQYGDLATYQSQPTTNTPTALVLQGLLHLYHLTEGTGTVANDSTPNTPTVNGSITNGSWINGAIPGTKVLSFGGSGYVDCVVADSLTNKLAIGCWFSPSALIDQVEMIGRNTNYLLELSGTSGAIRFGLHIGGSWIYLTTPAGTIPVNGRGFALAVYDGTNMYLYVANPAVINQLLTYSQAQTGNLDSPTGDIYIGGSAYQGVVAEAMIWGRSLSAQEVQELFFRPLTRIVTKGTTATLTGNAMPSDVIQGQTFYNTDPNNKLTGTLSWAFTKGLRVQQKLTLLLQIITTKAKDHVCQMTRVLVTKIITTGANDHTCQMTRTKSLTLYVTKWFVDIDSQQAALGSTDHEGLNVVNSGSTLTFTATPNLSNAWILKMTNTFMFDTTLVTATSIQSVSPYAGTYTIAAQTVGTVHELKPIWLKGFIVIGGSNTTINGYNSVASGSAIGWSAVGSAGTGNHWEYYWNGIDVGRSSGSQTAVDGTVNSATCAILTGT